jgi:hypothetical protein
MRFIILALFCFNLNAIDIQFGWNAPTNGTNIAYYNFRQWRSNTWQFLRNAGTTTNSFLTLQTGIYIVAVSAVASNGLESDVSNSITVDVKRVTLNLEASTNNLSNWTTMARLTNDIAIVSNSIFYRGRLTIQ